VVAVHQVLPVFAPRDAIGNHTAAIRTALRGWGFSSEIFAEEVNPGAGPNARTIRDIDPARMVAAEPTIWLYHASTGTPVAEWWAGLPGHKALDYHNISPASVLGAWEPHVGVELEHGRRQLADLATVTDWAIADSAYNETELKGLGYRWTGVVPILLATDHLADEGVDPASLARLESRKQGAEWLFVSRLLPHKAQHDLIKAFAAYRLAYDPAARLSLVGATGSARYADALADFVDDLGLGSVPAGELGARYRVADVYVSASEHEGFGVPLLEAMAHDVPVVAFASSAVPETVGGGALVIDDKRPTVFAAAVHRVLSDASLQESLRAAGRARLDELGLPATTARLRAAVDHMVAEAGLG
jgi:glycosyltransferase involved in cell wall biosynthesis